jgi:predicted HTH transcriptional regulator
MEQAELLELIEKGEDSKTQFKKYITNATQLAQEMVAMIIHDSSANDIDKELFYTFYEKQYGENIETSGLPLEKILENLTLARENKLNLAGLLLFGKNPQRYEPVFLIKAVCFFGNEIGGTHYRDSEDIDGNISKQYRNGMAFLLRNLRKIQKGTHFNTPGVLEVSEIALQEILVNALIHRDYFIGAPIRILIFDNMIEIDNPGKLPNSLTIENIKSGISCIRNRIIASYAFKMLPYRGLGSGIIRALKDDPNIEFINNASAERFKVIIRRPV